MNLTLQIEKMTVEEKLQAMEALWSDLSRNAPDVTSPAWHRKALKETEARYAAGKEGVSDWEEAKKELRERFQ
ncbi:MAG: addiction module protein [Kiritimatiellae bacterium]|nr:addiction module protein [Kiritimatiellia bacterium]